jgi:hypothetical protein
MSELRVLVERAGDWWVAQCIEYDLATQVRSLSALHDELDRLIASHIESSSDLGVSTLALPPAPSEVQQRYELAATRLERVSRPRQITDAAIRIGEIRIVG